MSEREFKISPIGYVRIRNGKFYIEIEKEYRPALKKLETFSHINVLWWCHLHDKKEDRKIIECRQPYKNSPLKIGIFATRSEFRPNPIALTVVSILKIDHERGIIYVPYIDAVDGTPIIDLKPYHPSIDRVRDVSVAKWCDHWPKWYEDSADFDWESEFNFPH
jgi:tRNA-Thr(GGU) m(6)t(6)A37 methyltransferase TsaA